MPDFNYNPSNVSSGFQVFPADTYEVVLGEPKTFYREGKKGPNWGIMFVSKIASEGKYKGKKIAIQLYMHTEESQGFSKSYQMSAFGFMPRKQDDDFDLATAEKDWRFNTDTHSVGDGWMEMKGQTIVLDLDTGINEENGDEQQKIKAVRPFVI